MKKQVKAAAAEESKKAAAAEEKAAVEEKKAPASGGLAREIARYLLFGVFTTAVSMVSNFGILWGGQWMLGIDDTASGRYLALYSVAKVVSWLCAVLFAFFSNKKWVFHDSGRGREVGRQLCVFAGGRVLTLGLDYLLNYLMLMAMRALALTGLDGLFGISLEKYNEMAAWLVAQVAVVVSNYFISRIFVFKRSKSAETAGK